MKYLYVLMLTGCGVHAHVDPIQTDPIKVVHTVTIDFNAVYGYCDLMCKGKAPNPVTGDTCTQECYANFLTLLSNAVK